jgi:glutathione S-transferase
MTTTPDLIFYGSPVSPFVRKAMACAMEKGAAFDVEAVNIMDMPDWFLEISPMRRIPVMRDRSIASEGAHGTIADSSAICAYIEKKHPAPALYPADAYDHARALMIEEYADSMLAPVGGLGLFRPLFFTAMQGKEPDVDTARETWTTKLPPVLAWLDAELGDGEFFVGNAFSIADISVATVFMQLQLVAECPLTPYPNLAAFMERMAARPSIAEPYAKAERFVRKALPERINLT